MIVRGTHHTRYEYGGPVDFGPHLLYLRPRDDPRQRLLDFRIQVSPTAELYPARDAYDNALTWAYFKNGASTLRVETAFLVRTTNAAFQFILSDYAVRFPFYYESVLKFALGPYLAPPFPETQAALRAWSAHLFDTGSTSTVDVLTKLTTAIFESLDYRSREEVGIQSAAQTLQLRSGSCRDFAVLMMEQCRARGLAARFVSGYLFSPAPGSSVATGPMHAWVEVYLPGGGWIGFDPTHARVCDDTYIAVAHSAQAEVINPIQGSFAGSPPAGARLVTETMLENETVTDAAPFDAEPATPLAVGFSAAAYRSP